MITVSVQSYPFDLFSYNEMYIMVTLDEENRRSPVAPQVNFNNKKGGRRPSARSRLGLVRQVLDILSDVMRTSDVRDVLTDDNDFVPFDDVKLSPNVVKFINKELRFVMGSVQNSASRADDAVWATILRKFPGRENQIKATRYLYALAFRLLNGTLASRLNQAMDSEGEISDQLIPAIGRLIDYYSLRERIGDSATLSSLFPEPEKDEDLDEVTFSEAEINEYGIDPYDETYRPFTPFDFYEYIWRTSYKRRDAEILIRLLNFDELTISKYREFLKQEGLY